MPISYSGDRHQLIVAPTRGGKAVSGAVPRLLEHTGSAIVLDVKDGELARITARFREEVLGQRVILIDPYDIVADALGYPQSRLNPLARIDIDGDNSFDEALLSSTAIVVPSGPGENHWDGEAESLITGITLSEVELGGDLADVRAVLNRDRDGFKAYVERMLLSPYKLVRAAGGRIDNKEERELSGVMSTAHRNTHFLESYRLAASLSGMDVNLDTIGENTTIYIILPARRIRTAKSWLRLLVATLINAVTALDEKPEEPVMILLEEMATLERMAVIEQSFGLMAGFGLQLLGVVQDFTQLRDIYRERWQTFIANAATVQCFGTNDFFTAKYLSDLSGATSIEKLSYESAERRASLLGDPDYETMSDGAMGRPLIRPDELMTLHPSVQFMKLAASRPAIAWRPAYFLDARFRDPAGRPLYDIHPNHAHLPIPRPVNFAKPGLDLGRVLAEHLKVG